MTGRSQCDRKCCWVGEICKRILKGRCSFSSLLAELLLIPTTELSSLVLKFLKTLTSGGTEKNARNSVIIYQVHQLFYEWISVCSVGSTFITSIFCKQMPPVTHLKACTLIMQNYLGNYISDTPSELLEVSYIGLEWQMTTCASAKAWN